MENKVIKVSLLKNEFDEFVGPWSMPMDKVLFYCAQLILKPVQKYKKNDHIHGVTHNKAKLRFLPTPPFPERKNANSNNFSLFVIGIMLRKVFPT